MTPKEEVNSLLNEAIGMALRLIEKHGSHIRFVWQSFATNAKRRFSL